MRAEGQNTLVINPGNAADQVLRARPPVVVFAPEPSAERGAVVMDLTSAYARATRVQRGFQLFNRRRHVLIQDEIRYAAPADVWWFMHFAADKTATLDPDGTARDAEPRLGATLAEDPRRRRALRGARRRAAALLAQPGGAERQRGLPQTRDSPPRRHADHAGGVRRAAGRRGTAARVAARRRPAGRLAHDRQRPGLCVVGAGRVRRAASLVDGGPLERRAAPAAARGATLEFFSGRVLPAGPVTLQNDLPAEVTVNTLTLGGTSTGEATVTLAGAALTLAEAGTLGPVVNLDALAGGKACATT